MFNNDQDLGELLLRQLTVQVDARDNYGNTPLMLAACHERLAIAPLLLRAGADVDARNNVSRLLCVCVLLNVFTPPTHCSRGCQDNVTPLIRASANKASKMALWLLENGADPAAQGLNGSSAFGNAYRFRTDSGELVEKLATRTGRGAELVAADKALQALARVPSPTVGTWSTAAADAGQSAPSIAAAAAAAAATATTVSSAGTKVVTLVPSTQPPPAFVSRLQLPPPISNPQPPTAAPQDAATRCSPSRPTSSPPCARSSPLAATVSPPLPPQCRALADTAAAAAAAAATQAAGLDEAPCADAAPPRRLRRASSLSEPNLRGQSSSPTEDADDMFYTRDSFCCVRQMWAPADAAATANDTRDVSDTSDSADGRPPALRKALLSVLVPDVGSSSSLTRPRSGANTPRTPRLH